MDLHLWYVVKTLSPWWLANQARACSMAVQKASMANCYSQPTDIACVRALTPSHTQYPLRPSEKEKKKEN
eukprot:8045963-Pyramimonas_sp.AAC.1